MNLSDVSFFPTLRNLRNILKINILITEIVKANEWYDEFEELHELALDYRVKSIQSAVMKYNRAGVA